MINILYADANAGRGFEGLNPPHEMFSCVCPDYMYFSQIDCNLSTIYYSIVIIIVNYIRV